MTSCLSGSGSRTYSFDLDIVKPPPTSRSSSHSSSPSSTLSECSNSSIRISTKGLRAPRKRPNQAYNEASALLATLYPSVFAIKGNIRTFHKPPGQFNEFAEPQAELVYAFPAAPSNAAFLLGEPPPSPAWNPLDQKPLNFLNFTCENSQNAECTAPGAFEDEGFTAETILDEEVEEGIDSILGDTNSGNKDSQQSTVNQHRGSLMELGLASRVEFGLAEKVNLRRALRRGEDDEWWRSPAVAISDIVPKFNKLSATETMRRTKKKKKKKSKVVKVNKIDSEASLNSAIDATVEAATKTSLCREESLNLKPSLGLKLDYEDIIAEWSDRRRPFADAPIPEFPESYVCS